MNLRSRRLGERGAVTAEFAVALPAVVAVVALCIGALATVGRQVRLEQAVAQGARLAARGEPADAVHDVVARISGAGSVAIAGEGDLVCVSAAVAIAAPFPEIRARSCALAGDP
ncbi:TadE family protein [Microbacterium sp. W1N]|uniref:TadE family type IV pilus minor pilin n=1 Tax=Microbacterium festucae TaxID=2977531 RepID=UPI0021BE1468|nr:TadE family type IV pilus minor pilin [Microbacterium festucae]MCT9821001.1 TadE family protein [Microbacterium festucae]